VVVDRVESSTGHHPYAHCSRFRGQRALTLPIEVRGALATPYRAVGRQVDAGAQDTIADDLVRGRSEYRTAELVALRGNRVEAPALLEAALAEDQKPFGKARIEPKFLLATGTIPALAISAGAASSSPQRVTQGRDHGLHSTNKGQKRTCSTFDRGGCHGLLFLLTLRLSLLLQIWGTVRVLLIQLI
jgi:hypothetical protein